MRLIGGALAALLALWLHTLTERVWPGGARFALLFPTILLSCLVLGRVGGLSALATGLVGVWTLMMPSRGDLAHVSSGDLSALCLYAASGLLVVVVTEAYRAISRQLLAERDGAARRKAEEDARFVELFRNAPGLVAIYRGHDLVVEFASAGLVEFLGRGEIQDRSYRQVAPETAPALFALMTKVMDDGQPYVGRQMRTPFQARPDVPPEERYFDILLRRIEPASDGQARLFVQALDVTEAVLTSQENQKAEAQLHAVLEEMPVGVVLLSLETRQVVLYNRAASLIVGHDVLTRSAEQFGVYGAMHADGAPFAPEDYPAARALSGETIEKEEQLYRRPDGRIVRLSVDCKRVADGTGRPLVVCTFTDVTDLRQALDAKSLLVNELNHRVKNTLATVQALAGQTFCGDAAQPGAREAFEGRLLALSRAHNVLTQADWRTASLMRIIHEAIEPFGAARFAVGGEDVQLPPQKAVAVAMALHELATNAVKYGALTREQGRVSIDCEDADGRTRLEWREQGGPPVEEPRQIGFGMRLLTRALDRDVDGGIDVTFAPAGVTCVIRGL